MLFLLLCAPLEKLIKTLIEILANNMNVEIIEANYGKPEHQRDIPMLLNEYALDPMGGGAPLEEKVISDLVANLAKVPKAFTLLAYVDEEPAGLANCFEGFSTFACRPLLNIHDIMVRRPFRGQGISQKLLAKIEEIAAARHCCKITLEVLSNNEVAKGAYRKFGFSDYQLDPNAGSALFWQKSLK